MNVSHDTEHGAEHVPTNSTGVVDEPSVPNTNSEIDTNHFSLDQFLANADLSRSSIAILQHADADLLPLLKYLKNNELPLSQKLSRQILLEASDYIIADGVLLHSRVAKSRRTKDMCQYQIVVPKSLIKTILELYHDSVIGAHGGITDTLDRIKEHYFFPKMSTYVSDYVKSCTECQSRKLTKVHTKASITSYPTPSRPFQVWQVDLLGPLPTTYKGNVYVFTAVDMFSKFLYAQAIPSKDALTVSSAMYQMFCQYGVCHTILSDQGSEFIARVTQEVCKHMGIKQQFTPSFAHHCLGACERLHKTFEERMTPFVNDTRKNWDDLLLSIVFAINLSVNSSLGYAPFEILFGQRPSFPLVHIQPDNLYSLSPDCEIYMQQFLRKLKTIRSCVLENVEQSKQIMVDRVNSSAKDLHLSKGDYVYLHSTQTGKGQKLQPVYTGPYVVDQVCSDHRVILSDPISRKCQPHPIHVNRLKMAYVRQPSPCSYLTGSVTTRKDLSGVDCGIQTENPQLPRKDTTSVDCGSQTSNSHFDNDLPSNKESLPTTSFPVRPKRTCGKPVRYRVAESQNSFSTDSDSAPFYKVKRVIGQKGSGSSLKYLLQFAGEPAQNAVWIDACDLNKNMHKAVRAHPPPILE